MESPVMWGPKITEHMIEERLRVRCYFSNVLLDGIPQTFGKFNRPEKELERLCRQEIDSDQQVLEPLLKLWGVGNVKIEGTISKEWTEYLKVPLESAERIDIGIFKRTHKR
jgi:hypothetical protein